MLHSFITKAGFWWMFPIVLLSFVGLALGLERLWFWLRIHERRLTRSRIINRLLKGQCPLDEAVEAIRNSGDVTLAPHLALIKHEKGLGLAIARSRADERLEILSGQLRRFSGTLAFIANLSGTLGLLGTVAGVSMSFEDLAMSNPKRLALSLSTAMYTTLGGIMLFVLTYFFLFVFGHLADKTEGRIERELDRLQQLLDLGDAAASPTASLRLPEGARRGEPTETVAVAESATALAKDVGGSGA